MKLLLSTLIVCCACSFVHSQVNIDKPVQLTGTGADAKISGIKTVSSPEDGVSAEVLQLNELAYAPAVLTAGVYELNLAPAITALQSGMLVHFRADAANTGPCSLRVNATAAAPLTKHYDQPLAANDIRAGQMVSAIYDAANGRYQMLSQLGNAGGGAASNMSHSLSASPSSMTVARGFSSQSVTLQSTYLGGTPAPTTISVAGLPSGITIQLTPAGGYPSYSSALVFVVSNATATGTYPLTITANGGASSQSVAFTLQVVDGYRVFVTSTTYTGAAIGGLSGADAKCQSRAAAAGLSGTYFALMGDGSTSMSSRVTSSSALFINMAGNIVATSKADFFDGALEPFGIQYDEFVTPPVGAPSWQQYVWTGSTQTGGLTSVHCSNWSSNSGSGAAGWAGAYTSGHLNGGSNQTCSNAYPIYCIGN